LIPHVVSLVAAVHLLTVVKRNLLLTIVVPVGRVHTVVIRVHIIIVVVVLVKSKLFIVAATVAAHVSVFPFVVIHFAVIVIVVVSAKRSISAKISVSFLK